MNIFGDILQVCLSAGVLTFVGISLHDAVTRSRSKTPRCCCPECTGDARTCPHWAGRCRCILDRAEQELRELRHEMG